MKPSYVAKPTSEEFEGLLLGQVIYSEELYFRTISKNVNDGKDIESFTQMSFFELGLGEVEDSEFVAKDGPTVERFFLQVDGHRIGVYLLDVREPLDEGHIARLSEALKSSGASDKSIRALLISNDQMTSDWTVRTPLNPQHNALAKSRGISVVAVPELARLVVKRNACKWSKQLIAKDIVECGPGKLMPPASIFLGSVYKLWPKIGVLGIIPTKDIR